MDLYHTTDVWSYMAFVSLWLGQGVGQFGLWRLGVKLKRPLSDLCWLMINFLGWLLPISRIGWWWLEHEFYFSHIFGTLIPTDQNIFQSGIPPTRENSHGLIMTVFCYVWVDQHNRTFSIEKCWQNTNHRISVMKMLHLTSTLELMFFFRNTIRQSNIAIHNPPFVYD